MKSFNLRNFDLKVLDWIVIDMVRTQGTIDSEAGLGWVAHDVCVQITQVNDITVCFEFNKERHFALKDDVKPTNRRPSLFQELDKIIYIKKAIPP